MTGTTFIEDNLADIWIMTIGLRNWGNFWDLNWVWGLFMMLWGSLYFWFFFIFMYGLFFQQTIENHQLLHCHSSRDFSDHSQQFAPTLPTNSSIILKFKKFDPLLPLFSRKISRFCSTAIYNSQFDWMIGQKKICCRI